MSQCRADPHGAKETQSGQRQVAISLHPNKPEAIDAAVEFVHGLHAHGIGTLAFGSRAEDLAARAPGVSVSHSKTLGDASIELMVVFGGDGSILRASEWAVPMGIPLLGVNLGHVGFLAELDPSEVGRLVRQVAERDYEVESRLTLEVEVRDATGDLIWQSFAVNEVSVEKWAREKMLDLLVEVDRRPLYRFGCDGLVISTPTGSTAYAFSLLGPVVWPNVQAFLVVPMAAHALFARPLVLSPDSTVDVTLAYDLGTRLVVWCDGGRTIEIDPTARIHVHRGQRPLLVARLSEQPFTTRLVKKFNLNVDGFRKRR